MTNKIVIQLDELAARNNLITCF